MTHIATCDLGGICRSRSVLSRELDLWVSQGIGWVPSSIAMSPLGSIVPGTRFGAVGDLRLVPDLGTSTTLPAIGFHPEVTLLLGDLLTPSGTEWDCSTRGFLRGAIADLRAETGMAVRASFEHEFSILGLPHVQAPLSLSALRRVEPFGTHLVDALDRAGLAPETWHPEYGPNQWEITLAPAEAAKAADRAILLREVVRHVADALDLRVTFSPTPHVDSVGNGVHVHLSLCKADGSPSSYDPARQGQLSIQASSFAAGILRHAAALTAITAPSPVSALRFGPGHWSVASARAGREDREALVRICPPVLIADSDPADHVRLEYRGADATGNPWIVMGALIRAGLDGIRHGWELPEPRHATSRPAEVGEPMPSSLTASLDALTSDLTALGWFPKALAETYLTVKRDEVARTAAMNSDQLVALYADLY